MSERPKAAADLLLMCVGCGAEFKLRDASLCRSRRQEPGVYPNTKGGFMEKRGCIGRKSRILTIGSEGSLPPGEVERGKGLLIPLELLYLFILSPYSGTMTGGLRGPYLVPRTKPRSAMCKSITLPTILSLWPLLYFRDLDMK